MPYITFNKLCILIRCLGLLNQVNMDSSHLQGFLHLCAKVDIIFTLLADAAELTACRHLQNILFLSPKELTVSKIYRNSKHDSYL